MEFLKSQGPEVMPDGVGIHPFINNVFSFIESSGKEGLKYFTDSKPELCSQKAIINYGAHFPAGTSYKSLDHYR